MDILGYKGLKLHEFSSTDQGANSTVKLSASEKKALKKADHLLK